MPLDMWGHLLAAWRARERRRMAPAALVASVIANVHRDGKQRKHPFTPEDFLGPDPDEDPTERMRKEQEALLQRMKAYVATQSNGPS